jgi:hypothetical protein
MATSRHSSDIVGCNVQVAVDTEHHLIMMHDVTKVGSDVSQLSHVAKEMKARRQTDILEAQRRSAEIKSPSALTIWSAIVRWCE